MTVRCIASELFPGLPRARPVRRMHVADAGQLPGGSKGVRFKCRRCGHDTGWLHDARTVSENKRGISCPICNEASK